MTPNWCAWMTPEYASRVSTSTNETARYATAATAEGASVHRCRASENLASSVYVVARLQLGGGGMPPFARLLGSEEIASVATFVRQSWENGYGPVSDEQVELQWNGFRRGMRYGTAVPTDF